MASDTGAPYTLHFPDDADPVDVAGDMQTLATDTHNALAAVEALYSNIANTPGGPVVLPPEITALPAQVASLQTQNASLVAAINDLSSHVTRYVPQVLRWSSATDVTLPAGQGYSNISGYSWTWTAPTKGVLLLTGYARLSDSASVAGDPRVRIDVTGAVSSFGRGAAQSGIGAGGQAVTVSSALEAVVRCNGGAITIKLQGGHSSATGRPGTLRQAGISGIFVPQLGSFPTVTLPQDPDNSGDGED